MSRILFINKRWAHDIDIIISLINIVIKGEYSSLN
jgi:hypothetical protein